jgi:hypothetical protein
MTIDNQCINMELASPVYFVKDETCHIQFPRKVNPNSKIKVNFITDIDQEAFGGALLYHLQQKEGASIGVQLLVIWGYEDSMIYSHTWLIEHESTLVWDEDKLEKLYHIYDSQHKAYSNLCWRVWSLDHNGRLDTKCRSSNGGFEIEVIISVSNYILPSIRPLWVDSNR